MIFGIQFFKEKEKDNYSLIRRGLNKLKRLKYPLYKPIIAVDPEIRNAERIFYFSSEHEELAKSFKEILNANEIEIFTGNTLEIRTGEHGSTIVEPDREYHRENL